MRLRRPAAVLVVALLLAACGGEDGPSPEVIARVGKTQVAYTAFAEFVERQTDSPVASLESPVLSSLLDQYLDELLLVRLAAERGLIEEAALPADGGPASDATRRAALEALIQDGSAGRPTRAELRRRYQEETELFEVPERVRLWQILVEDRATAERVRARLAAGAEFQELAREHSVDPSATYGGLQGELAREDLPEELAATIFELEPGEVSDVVEADYGFHVFLVTERLPGRTLPFEEAAPALEARLWEERVDRRLEEVVERARSRYTVEVYGQNLPFAYRGTHAGPPPADRDSPDDE